MSQRARAEGAPPPSPECIALAKFLRYNTALKNRVGVINGKRVEFFKGRSYVFYLLNLGKGKRVIRELLSDAYKKKAQKTPLLPKIDTREQAVAAFRLLQTSLLALRVEKVGAHHGHDHEHTDPQKKKKEKGDKDKKKKKKKKKKSPTTEKQKPPQNLSIQRDQSAFADDDYFAWFYETTQLQTILGGIGIIVVVFGAILFPLWPPILRTVAWYLSMALLGFIAGIAVIAVIRLILFIITVFALPPGIWLFPNLFEDVGFFESFVPLWAWQKQPKSKRKKGVIAGGEKKDVTTAGEVPKPSVVVSSDQKRLHTTVEDGSDDE
jgi:translocation protein SEC62